MQDHFDVKNIAIIGAGIQGHAIAQTALMAGFNKVILNDLSIELIDKAVDRIVNDSKTGLKILEKEWRLVRFLWVKRTINNLL